MYQNILSQAGFSMDRLANFCAVADEGSIAIVAKGDPSRQSLISRQIRELESFFGVDLIRRKGRGLEITEAGRDLAAIGRQNFKGLEDYSARCRGREWSVRIVASNSIAQWLLLPRLKAVAETHPDVRFEINHAQTREMVAGTREGTYDISFIRKDALVPGLRHTTLGEVGHSVYIPAALAKKVPKSAVGALTSLPLAIPVAGTIRESMERLAARNGGTLRVSVSCTSFLQAALAVQSGMYAAVLPDSALPSLKDLRVHRIALPDRYTLCLAWTARNVDTRPPLARLLESLRSAMTLQSQRDRGPITRGVPI